MSNKEKAMEWLKVATDHDKVSAELLSKLITLTHEEKLDIIAEILADEWYSVNNPEFIKSILDDFVKSLRYTAVSEERKKSAHKRYVQ